MDLMQIWLNETLYRERLAAAEQERHRRATWVVAPGPIQRLRLAIGRQLLALVRQAQLFVRSSKGNLSRSGPARLRKLQR